MLISLPLWQRPGSSPGLAKFHLDGPETLSLDSARSRSPLDPLSAAAVSSRPTRVRLRIRGPAVFGSADGRSESRVRKSGPPFLFSFSMGSLVNPMCGAEIRFQRRGAK